MAALQEKFDAQLAKTRKATEDLNKQLNAKQLAQEAREAEDVRIASMVLTAMSKIPKPKDGKNGRDGEDGIDGIHGIDGVRGLKGNTGPQGPTGKTGAKGDTGEQGIQGPQGEQGIQGVQGEVGPEGRDGVLGAKGDKGDTGEQGVQGISGQDGADGKDGINGERGNVGQRGSDGLQGLQGPKGLDGINGTDGKDGAVGAPGKAGKDGKDGKEGARGKKGDKGLDGVSIEDFTAEGPILKVKLSNGKTKEVNMPIRGSGKGGSPITPPAVQHSARTPFKPAGGLKSVTVQDALVETVGKIQQAASGNPFTANTPEAFMYDFNFINDTHSSEFVYNGSKQLINTSIVNSDNNVLYLITFTYSGKVLESKLILDIVKGDSVDTLFTYIDGLLVSKRLTYSL